MQNFEHIPFIATTGSNYSLEFIEDENDWGIKIVTISISLLSIKNNTLSYKDLLNIGAIFKRYLLENKDSVLVYICDDSPLSMNNKNKNLSPQAYRDSLFNLIFERLDNGEFHKANSALENNGEVQYLAFIGHAANRANINKCVDLVINKLGD